MSAKEGVVTLEGTVANEWEQRYTELVAQRISGVSEVKNNLKVHQEVDREDEGNQRDTKAIRSGREENPEENYTKRYS